VNAKTSLDVSIQEYPESGQEIDVFGANIDGTKIIVEIIWTPSKAHFLNDLLIISRADADYKCVLANPKILQKSDFVRNYEKTRASEVKKGVLISKLHDAKKALTDEKYLQMVVKEILDAVAQRKLGQSETDKPVQVNGGTSNAVSDVNRLDEVPTSELRAILAEIANPSTDESYEMAWTDLNNLARNSKLWESDDYWSFISDALNNISPNSFKALDNLRMVSYNAVKLQGKSGIFSIKVREDYLRSLEQLLSSPKISRRNRIDVKQIIEACLDERESFHLFWRIWVAHICQAQDTGSQYEDFVAPFINEILYARAEQKAKIQSELRGLLKSNNPEIRKKAKEMYGFLFS
jgi:hypothetical protein